jgi:hypothetical protein
VTGKFACVLVGQRRGLAGCLECAGPVTQTAPCHALPRWPALVAAEAFEATDAQYLKEHALIRDDGCGGREGQLQEAWNPAEAAVG